MKKKHVHFMGIGGSGISGVAALAASQGFSVSGCDLEKDSPYSNHFAKHKIKKYVGHDMEHLKGVDILAVSPALFFSKNKHPELESASKLNKLLTWQKFLGSVLMKGKFPICVAGTHGKSTTTAMLALLLEKAGFDPSVMIGATVKKWDANFRIGESKYFVVESDEFYDNFLNYKPEVVVLNNIEYDHPDYFKSRKQYWESYAKFVQSLSGSKILVFNQDDEGIRRLFSMLGGEFLATINLYGYTLGSNTLIKADNSTLAAKIVFYKRSTGFVAKNKTLSFEEEIKLSIPGEHNVSNALGVVTLANLLGIANKITKTSLAAFGGIGRRLELVSKKGGVYVYSDYGHHPTEIRATLKGLRQKHPDKDICAVVEPHSFSRTKALLASYKGCFDEADKVIITPIFRARDVHNFGIDEGDLAKASDHGNITFYNERWGVIGDLFDWVKKGKVIIIFGAGKSYQLAREIVEKLCD